MADKIAEQNTVARSLHDLGLAAWFGGSLMGAVGLNGASAEVSDPRDRTRVADAGWARWTPVNLVGILVHLLGGLQITRGNKGRLAVQQKAGVVNATKAAITGAALGATAYSRVLGQKIMDAEAEQAGVPSEDATTPGPGTPDEVAQAQKQLKALQWAVPALTGTLLVLNAKASEQQRPSAVASGLLSRLNPAD